MFPLRWSAHESLTVHEGPVKQASTGTSYFDAVAGREVFVKDKGSSGNWDIVFTDWNASSDAGPGKEYHIRLYRAGPRNATIIRHCIEWCPPDTPVACDASDSLCQPAYVKNGKFVGPTTIPN